MLKQRSLRQKKVLYYINDKNCPPTIRQICEAVNLKSSPTLKGHLDRLKELGYVEWGKARPRNVIHKKRVRDGLFFYISASSTDF